MFKRLKNNKKITNPLIPIPTKRLDKLEADINALKAEGKVTHQKLDMIIDEVATSKEQTLHTMI